MMMTFITRGGEGQGKTNKKRKATNSKGRGLGEGASRALMRQVEDDDDEGAFFVLFYFLRCNFDQTLQNVTGERGYFGVMMARRRWKA